MSDPFKLDRFVEAQDRIFDDVRAELSAARKTSHWMWFVFPQIQGLGLSPTARLYAISSKEEARAYLAHPVLGARLLEVCGILAGLSGKSAHDIFGSPDDLKLRSSLTLFAEVSRNDSVFRGLLEKYYGGAPDPRTLEKL